MLLFGILRSGRAVGMFDALRYRRTSVSAVSFIYLNFISFCFFVYFYFEAERNGIRFVRERNTGGEAASFSA